MRFRATFHPLNGIFVVSVRLGLSSVRYLSLRFLLSPDLLSSTMPRRSSAGRSAPRAARHAAPVRNPPQPAMTHAPPAPVQGGGGGGGSILGGIGSTIAQGMAFGTGSAVAHRAVDAVLGPRTVQHETVVSQPTEALDAVPMGSPGVDACGVQSKAFQDCINSNGSDISKCQFYLDMLAECRRASPGLGA